MVGSTSRGRAGSRSARSHITMASRQFFPWCVSGHGTGCGLLRPNRIVTSPTWSLGLKRLPNRGDAGRQRPHGVREATPKVSESRAYCGRASAATQFTAPNAPAGRRRTTRMPVSSQRGRTIPVPTYLAASRATQARILALRTAAGMRMLPHR